MQALLDFFLGAGSERQVERVSGLWLHQDSPRGWMEGRRKGQEISSKKDQLLIPRDELQKHRAKFRKNTQKTMYCMSLLNQTLKGKTIMTESN